MLPLWGVLAGLVWLTVLPAKAHNLNERADYLGFDPDTLAMFQSRSDTGAALIQPGDTIGLLMKATPDLGTATGAGGYSTFFVPVGTQVVGADYGRITSAGSFLQMPMKGQSILALGDGRLGAKKAVDLIGLELGPNIVGQTALVVDSLGVERGTMAGVYSDTGIFFSTDPKTAWQSWAGMGGLDRNTSTTSDNLITTNSGDVVLPVTRWDGEQLVAFGSKGPIGAIVDKVDQRGNTPWGMGSGVAGPQSSYAWSFDKGYYDTHPADSSRIKHSIEVGPWNRLKYPGSLASMDTPGLKSTALGYVGVDASEFGTDLLPGQPLPVTSSWSDSTSPKAVRLAWGFLELYRPEFARLQIKIVNGPGSPGSAFDSKGYLQANGDTFGGDAGGEFNNQDHLWRYYEPSTVSLVGKPFIFKQASKPIVQRYEVFTYKVWVINFSSDPLTNVVIEDQLPSGVAFISASPTASSGPNPLRWTMASMPPNSVRSFTITVKGTTLGVQRNVATSYSDGNPPQSSTEVVTVASQSLLYADKAVTPTTALPGDTVTYTMSLENGGSVASSTPVVITERLPTGFKFDSYVGSTINGVAGTASDVTVVSSNPASPVFTLKKGINPGQMATITFRAKIALTTAPGKYCNQFSYSYDGKVLSTGGLACVTVGQRNIGLGIGNLVFFDANGNNHADAGEGVQGVTLQLYAAGATPGVDAPVATTTSGADGLYLFENLTEGFYFVHVPAAMFQTGAPLHTYVSVAQGQFGDDDVGEDGLNDSDPPTQGVSSAPVFVGLGFAPTDQDGETGMNHDSDNGIDAAVDLTVDFGFQSPVAVGNLIFNDLNGNGHADPGEGVGGVTVELYDAKDKVESAAYLHSTVTTADGHYLFDHLAAGDYKVHIPASNFQPGQPLAGLLSLSDAIVTSTGDDDRGENGQDSLAPIYTGVTSKVVHLVAGAAPVDAAPGSTTGETGYLASEDNLTDANVDLTVDFGFTSTPPPFVGLGNLIFKDLNGNRHYDPGEGVDGVTVQLFQASGTNPLVDAPLKTTVTTHGGTYLFTNLQPGDYYVFVPPSNFGSSGPLVHMLSIPGSGGDTGLDEDFDENGIDASEPSSTGVRSDTIHLALGTEPTGSGNEIGVDSFLDDGVDANYDLTVDLGFYEFVGVGNLVFKDANANGHYDPGEGVGGVPLQLFSYGSDPHFDVPLQTTVSDVDGKYKFTGLAGGSYIVFIPASAFALGAPLYQCMSVPDTSLLPGGDDDLDEDGEDAAAPSVTGIASHAITLIPGLAPTDADHETGLGASDDNLDDANFDSTIDFGFYPAGNPVLGIGNVIFKDANHNLKFDPGEGVAGVTVQLFASNDDPLNAQPIDVAVTDTRGAYLLTTDQPGAYVVFIPPSQFQPGHVLYGYQSLPGNGSDDAVDDDVDENGIDSINPAVTGIGSSNIHLSAGAEPIEAGFLFDMDAVSDANMDLTVDFGFDVYCPTITIGPDTLPNGMETMPYAQTLTASGGYPPYAFNVNGGALPAGLSLSESGELTGVSPTADTYSFTVTVVDAVGCSATRTYDFATVPVPKVALGNLVYIDVNHNGVCDVGEGVENVEVELFHAGDNPLTTPPIDEVITDVGGTYWFRGLSEGDYFVFIAPIEFTPGHPLAGLISSPGVSGDNGVDDDAPGNDNGIDDDQPDVNGVSSIVVHLRLGQEPTALTGETGFDSEIDDDSDADTDATIDLGFRDPCPVITVTPSTLPAATSGFAYSAQLSGAGGTGALAFSVGTGSLPPGMGLSSSGLISGTSTTVGQFSFAVRVTDVDGCTMDVSMSLNVSDQVGVGNLVFFDANANGRADAGEGIAGVTVQIYKNGDTPGVATPHATTTTSATGEYLFSGLESGSYQLHVPKSMFASAHPLAGMRSVSGEVLGTDDDAGEDGQDAVAPDQSGVSTASFLLVSGTAPTGLDENGVGGASDDADDANIDLTKDFGFVDANAQSATYAQWQIDRGLAGNNALPGANPDGDNAGNLMEYALGSNPSSGADSSSSAFKLVRNSQTSAMDVLLRRRHGGHIDLSYTLQIISRVEFSPQGWAESTIIPSIVNNQDGTETLTFSAVDQDVILAGSSMGFVRLLVSLDADGNGIPEASEHSHVLGWVKRSLPLRVQTLSWPFVEPSVFTGTVDSAAGSQLLMSSSANGADMKALMNSSYEYYVEVMDGALAGHRWDVDRASTTSPLLSLVMSSARNTRADVPASLAGAMISLRPHLRFMDVFPLTAFHANSSINNADQVQLWDKATNSYSIYWLGNTPFGQRWLRAGDISFASQNSRVLASGEAVFVRPRSAVVPLVAYGVVRSWDFVSPLTIGTSLVGSPYPMDESFTLRSMSVAGGFKGGASANQADKVYVWSGDTSSESTYSTYYLFSRNSFESWLKAGDVTFQNKAALKVFGASNGTLINSNNGVPNWIMHCPWTP